MRRMLKHTKTLRIEKLAFVLLLICLTETLSGCAGLRPFPAKYLIEYDHKNKVCGQYEIVDAENFKFKHVKDITCPSIFGFSESDIPKVLNWSRDAFKYSKEHCQ